MGRGGGGGGWGFRCAFEFFASTDAPEEAAAKNNRKLNEVLALSSFLFLFVLFVKGQASRILQHL